MNDDQLYYFLVNKNTRNVLQVEYPSDIDEFNKILGTSEGKGNLLKDLGIILGSETKTFKNPDLIVKQQLVPEKVLDEIKTTISDWAETVEFKPVSEILPVTVSIEVTSEPETKKKLIKKATTKKKAVEKPVEKKEPTQVNLFAGLFD